MASEIVPENIDTEYPQAGVDNDSQGFRTNFAAISANDEAAKTEIEDLQSKVLLKAPLTGESAVDNDLVDEIIRAATIVDFSEVIDNHELSAGPVEIDHTTGSYHILETTNDVNLLFMNWSPDQSLGRVRVEIDVTNVSHTVEIPPTVIIGVEKIQGYNPADFKITFNAPGIYIFEFTSYDAGITYAIDDLTRNKNDILSRTVTSSGGVLGDTEGMIACDGAYVYYCMADYDGASDIWSRVAMNATPW